MRKKAQLGVGPVDLYSYISFAVLIVFFILLFYLILDTSEGKMDSESDLGFHVYECANYVQLTPITYQGVDMTLADGLAIISSREEYDLLKLFREGLSIAPPLCSAIYTEFHIYADVDGTIMSLKGSDCEGNIMMTADVPVFNTKGLDVSLHVKGCYEE